MRKSTSGFTIVELLIVIVVIAVLATISIVAYNGIQARGRDSQRIGDVSHLTKALELYYADNGQYPAGSGSTVINSSWSTTADASWDNLITQLDSYLARTPTDPTNTQGAAVWSNVANYSYAYAATASNCRAVAASSRQTYILVYRLENSSQVNTLTGDCTLNPLGPYSASNYRVAK